MIAYGPAPTLLDHHGGQAQWLARNVSPGRVSCSLQEAEIWEFVLAPASDPSHPSWDMTAIPLKEMRLPGLVRR